MTTVFLNEDLSKSFGEDSFYQNKPLGDWAKLGDLGGQLWVNALYVGINYGIFWISEDAKYSDRSVHMLKSSLFSATWTQLLKDIVRKPRPNNPSSLKSFPSGHATHAFAFASVVATEHEWYWGLGAYSLATLVALSRVNDGAHRFNEVIAGATIGMSYGLGMHYLDKKIKSWPSKIYFSPTNDHLMIGYSTYL